MKKIPVLFFCLLSTFCFAQKESWHWFFGYSDGLDFSSGTAVLDTGSLNTAEGCAAVSDSSGSLLFYTDGLTVYDKNHTQLPNGTGLFGHPSSSQSSIIVKLPGS